MRTFSFLGASALALLLAPVLRANTFLEVRPGVVEESVPEGKTAKGKLIVRNTGDTEVLVEVEVRDEWATRTGLPSLPPSEWLDLKYPHPFVLKPGAAKEVGYTVTPPTSFNGEAMAMVVFGGPTSAGSGGTGYRFRQGIPFYMLSTTTVQGQIALASLQVYLNAIKQLEFAVELKNNGPVHVRAQGALKISNSRGAEIGNAPLAGGIPVFPTKTQKYYARDQKNNYSEGLYRGELSVAGEKGEILLVGVCGFRIDKKGQITITSPFAERPRAP
ncbi:MAG TPA: hypothetical protein PKZ00_00215 [Elusimicrobiota bacterium]|nr:hypothetical protein [Elusimicrobiota bacterium]HMZ25721.1 hypothetical protein [Elusimicrobiota bacterium]HNA59438.1 hypothetical protein [Elusimicrobiota bacterium]HNF57999.1 hypothetical protein [Elusimicrobiota bacterium]HNI55985.1 hypothetical protein [Elusimicrobiota bacterium]